MNIKLSASRNSTSASVCKLFIRRPPPLQTHLSLRFKPCCTIKRSRWCGRTDSRTLWKLGACSDCGPGHCLAPHGSALGRGLKAWSKGFRIVNFRHFCFRLRLSAENLDCTYIFTYINKVGNLRCLEFCRLFFDMRGCGPFDPMWAQCCMRAFPIRRAVRIANPDPTSRCAWVEGSAWRSTFFLPDCRSFNCSTPHPVQPNNHQHGGRWHAPQF